MIAITTSLAVLLLLTGCSITAVEPDCFVCDRAQNNKMLEAENIKCYGHIDYSNPKCDE